MQKLFYDDEKVKVMKDSHFDLEGYKDKNGLYLTDKKQEKELVLLTEKEDDEIKTWHEKLGHLNFSDMRK